MLSYYLYNNSVLQICATRITIIIEALSDLSGLGCWVRLLHLTLFKTMYNKREVPLRTTFCYLFRLFPLGQSSFDISPTSVKKQSFMNLYQVVHVLALERLYVWLVKLSKGHWCRSGCPNLLMISTFDPELMQNNIKFAAQIKLIMFTQQIQPSLSNMLYMGYHKNEEYLSNNTTLFFFSVIYRCVLLIIFWQIYCWWLDSFCSYYDPYRGVIVYFRVVDGTIKKGDQIYFMASGKVK